MCWEQNNKWKCAHVDCFSQHVSYILNTYYNVVNGIHYIKGKKVRKFYVYKLMNNHSIAKIY